MKQILNDSKSNSQWKTALMTMPDNSFFELLRSVFGKIKTPFTKQQLIKDLEKFLLREDIQKTIAAFINEDDEKIIAAVALFGKPTPEELERFFTGEFDCMQLHDIIVNLEERFILYRFKDEQKFRLALNPVLGEALAPFAANVSILFEPCDNEKGKPKKPAGKNAVLNDRLLAGLLSFVYQWEGVAFYKKEGTIRKQIADAVKICFPDINPEEIFGSLQVLGLFYAEEECLYPDKKRFKDFAALTARERMEYCAAGLIVYKEAIKRETHSPVEIQAPYYKNRIKEAVNFIHALTDSLYAIYNDSEKDSCITKTTIVRLTEFIKSKTGYTANTNYLIDVLIKTDLTLKLSDSLFQINYSLLTAHCSLKSVTIDSGSSIFVHPEINFADAIELASFLNIKEAGAVVRFELEKDSAVRAFDSGITARQITGLLSRLIKINEKKTTGDLPETLVWNLKEWEKRHEEVSLKKGIVLTLSSGKQYLANIMPLSAMIRKTLAPGVYLLNEDTEDEAVTALINAGIEIIAGRKNTVKAKAQKQPVKHFSNLNQSYFPVPINTKEFLPKAFNLKTVNTKKDSISFDKKEADTLIQNFLLFLKKMKLDKASYDELYARINRRLILCENQLKEANIRFEKHEARHMDYAGKQNIAKQAIAQGSRVEIVYPLGKYEKKIYGIPKLLEKTENGHNLAIITQDNEELNIPLAKISLLRRIKKSIFED